VSGTNCQDIRISERRGNWKGIVDRLSAICPSRESADRCKTFHDSKRPQSMLRVDSCTLAGRARPLPIGPIRARLRAVGYVPCGGFPTSRRGHIRRVVMGFRPKHNQLRDGCLALLHRRHDHYTGGPTPGEFVTGSAALGTDLRHHGPATCRCDSPAHAVATFFSPGGVLGDAVCSK